MMMIIIAGMLFGLAATALIWPLLPQRPRLRAAAFDGIVTSTSCLLYTSDAADE